MKKFIVSVPEHMYKKIKHICVDADRSVTAVMREIIQYWLDKRTESILGKNENLHE